MVGLALLITLIRRLRPVGETRRGQAFAGLALLLAGLSGLLVLEMMGRSYYGRVQGWTMVTLPAYERQDFGLMVTATWCAVALLIGWWIWMRQEVARLKARVWLKHSLWLLPIALFAMSTGGFWLLNHIKIEGSNRADLIFELRARTAVVGLKLANLHTGTSTAEFRRALDQLEQANPDFETIAWARVVDGKLVTVASTSPDHPLPAQPGLWYKRGRPDSRFSEATTAFSSAFLQDKSGTYAFYCEPWPNPGEGWMLFRISFDTWADTMGPVLMQATFIIMLSGVVAVTLVVFFLQRELSEEARLNYIRASAASDAKSELLTRASHELRTPIHGVLGYADLLQRSALDERQKEWIQALRGQGQHLLRLVNDLLDFGALQTGRLTIAAKPASPSGIAHESMAAVLPQAESRGLDCLLKIKPGTPEWVLGDSTRLRQIAVNLLGNAVKFTESGSVILRVSTIGPVDADGRVTLVFAVTDTGPGIPPEDLPGIFDPRGRLHRHPAEGAGLGLALTRSLCEAMGGHLSVESELGRGSTFTATVMLPVTAAPPHKQPAPLQPLPELGLRVLAIEDNTALRTLMSTWLDELGCLGMTAADGETALQMMRKTRFDAVIVDLGLPGISGLEVARWLRANAAELPSQQLWIVGLSAHASDADHSAALDAGMDVFLSKPVELAELAAALQKQGDAQPARPKRRLLDPELLSTDQIAAIIASVTAETPAKMETLFAAVAAGDWTKAEATAHYLCNNADVLGAGEFGIVCRQCENAARDGDAEIVRLAADEIKRLGEMLERDCPTSGKSSPDR